MEERCATCRWWAESPGYAPRGWRCCALTRFRGGTVADHLESRAIAVDAESYYAELVTAPEFGCVQWQAEP